MTTFAAITSTFNTDDLNAYTIICQYLPLAIHLHDDERIMYYIKQAHLCWDHQWDGWDKSKNITLTTTNGNTTLSVFDASLQLVQTLYSAITAYPPQHSHSTIIKMTSLATRMLKPRHAWSLNEEWKDQEEKQEEKKDDAADDVDVDEKKEEQKPIVECINGVAIRRSNPILHQLTPRPLTLPWRPLYDLVARSFWSSHRSFPISHHQQHHWSTTLRDLVVHARRYFDDNAAHEMLELFAWTHISPRDQEMFYRIQGLITLFIPTYTPAHQTAARTWLPDIVKHSIHLDIHNEAATHVYFSLLARVAKHVKGIVWDEYATHIFHILLQTLDLDVSGASSQHGTRAWPTSYFLLPSRHIVMEEIVKEFAIWCIHTYNPQIQSLLDQLFTTVQTYYHPSNQGKWTNYLGTLMAELARAYAERMGHEKRREVVYGKEYQLDPNDTKFVSTLRPLAFQALFSKSQHMISCAERTLRHLTYLFPHELFPSLLQQCCDALQDVTSSHRMMSAMHVLAAVAGPMVHRQLHPQGAGQLEQLMWLCLPGIDITDLMKTTRTMVWLGILFHYVPLIDARTTPSGAPLSTPSSPTETSDDARATTMRFEEWSVQFLESVLKNLTIIDKYAKKDFIDVQFARLLFRCMRSFFASLSTPILDILIKKLVTFLTHDHHPHAIKHFGIICHAITSSHSNKWLAAIFPPLYNKLIVTDAKGVTSISSHASSELEWSLYLLSSSVKHAGGDGEVLTPYIDRIRTLYTATLSHDEKKIRKHGLKLIRNTLKSLTMVYPREYHNVDPVTWNDPKWIHYETWGDYTPATPPDVVIPDIGLEWHVPNNNEMKHATKIVELTLQQPLSVLQSVAQGHVVEEKSDGKHESPVEHAIRQVLNTCRGIHAVMGMIKGKPILPHDYDRDVDEHVTDKAKATSPTHGTSMTWITSTGRCPLVIPTRRAPQTPMVYSYIPVDSNLRTYLLRLCHSLLTKLVPAITISRDTSHATQPALHAITLIVKLIRLLIQLYGVVPMKLQFDQWQSTVTRTILREYYTGYEPTPMRALYISHAWDRYHTRLIDLSYGQTYTIDVRHIMDDLRILATHDFIKLRDRARDILMMTCQHFPLGIHDTITYMLDVITNKSSTEERLMGAISMLTQQPVHRWVANRWSRLSPFILTLCQYGEQHHDDKVQVALQQLFSAMYPDIHRLPLIIPPVTSTSHLPDDIISQRNDALSRLNTRLLTGYQHLIRSLLTLLSSSQPLHWKYQLMGASFLYSLLRADMPQDEITTTCYHNIILFFSRGLVSELLPLRKIAMIAMTHILGTHTLATRKRVNDIPSSDSKDDSKICITTPTSEGEWLSTSFQDYAAINWGDDINHIIRTVYRKSDDNDTYAYSIIRGSTQDPFPFQYTSSLPPASGLVARAIPTSTLHALHPLLIKSLPSLIDSIVHNHPSLAPANEGSSAQHASGGQSGAGDQIASAVYHHAPTRWPYTRCRQQGHAYDTIHVNLIRGIVETFPDMISSLTTQITRLTTAPHDRENQCAAAELFAGIIRGSRHLTYQHQIIVQQQLTTSVIPALETCQPDSVAFWYDACHQAITNKDGRRVAWLTRSLLSSAFGSLPDAKTDDTDMDAILESALARVDISPSIQFKRFHFLIPFLAEPSIRMDHITVWLLDQIRDGFMESPFKQVREEVGHVLCEITVALYQDTQETSPILWSFIKHIRDRLAAATAIIEAERTQHRTDVDHKPKHLLQTITYWLASGLNHGDYLEIHDVVVTFLPYLLQHHHHPDPEISAMCKYVTSLIAWSNMRTATTDVEITSILDGIIPVMKNESWHARVALLKFLQVFVPRHSLVLTTSHRSSIENIITTLLIDPQIEVREAASILLSAALTSASTSSTVEEWITKAMKWAKTKIKKANENGKQDGLSTRHAGVIVLSSIVLTHPYDVPDYLPRILATLSTHASDVESIASGVRKTFADFTRTHKDEWESFKQKFTDDELEALQSVVSAPTYFA